MTERDETTTVACINSYADAVAAGNALLRLPLEIRQDIFAYASLGHIREHNPSGWVDAGEILQGRQCNWLPPICHVNDDFFVESLPMFLRHSTMIVRASFAAYNLRFFLQATSMFANIYTLHFTTPKTVTPLSAGASLIKDCINLRNVWLSFHPEDCNFRPMHHQPNKLHGKIDKKAFAESYPFRQLLSLKYIESITLFIWREDELQELPEGADHFWGRAEWLEKKFSRRGLNVQVVSL